MRLPMIFAAACLVCALPANGADLTAAAAQAFLAAHANMAGVTVRPSGLQWRVIKSGSGRHFLPGDTAEIYFTAKLIDGTVVDGTSPGLPAPIDAGATLAGLGEALQSMREGDHWEVTVPPRLAFGAKGGGGGMVPPDQALIFDITLLHSIPAAQAAAAASRDGLSLAAGNGGTAAYWTIHP